MTKSRGLRLALMLGLLALIAMPGAPAGAQATSSAMVFAYSGNAAVGPVGIFLPGLDDPADDPAGWTWSFSSSLACQGSGVSGGGPAAGACNLSGAGNLLGDLFPQPHCGNSRGFSSTASITDPTGRVWSGEIHWDGVLGGDPSYSLGSQLLLFGTVNSDAGSANVVLLLNASGGQNCIPQVSPGGATSFTVNGVGILTSV